MITWAMVNLCACLCLVPSSWFREITPTRKKGPLIVRNLQNLRPIASTCPLECIFDACWLWRNKSALEMSMGAEQHGGRTDSLLLALSIVTCLQLRMDSKLPTLVKKADLLQGFDLSWRDGCLYQLAQAGVQGRDWLLQDSVFSNDRFRIKLSHLLSPMRTLCQFGIGQGKATSVHLFGTLTQGLAELYKATPGVELGVPRLFAGAVVPEARPDLAAEGFMRPSALPLACKAVKNTAAGEPSGSQFSEFTISERLVALELNAPHKVGLFQYVDDVFSLSSTTFSLSMACQADHLFENLWRHKFAEGAKGAAVMPVGCTCSDPPLPPSRFWSTPKAVDCLSVLGVLVDKDLSFEPLLAECCARFVKCNGALSAG